MNGPGALLANGDKIATRRGAIHPRTSETNDKKSPKKSLNLFRCEGGASRDQSTQRGEHHISYQLHPLILAGVVRVGD